MARLGDISTIQSGFARRRQYPPEAVPNGIPLLRPPDINADGEINEAPQCLVAVPEATTLERYRLEAGDILCIRTGRPGTSAVVTERQDGWIYSETLFRIRAGAGIDPAYLAHYLASPAALHRLGRLTHQSTGIQNITGRNLAELLVPLPEPEEQRNIVEIMAAVNEKIAAHRRIVETATELRTTLATHLFLAGEAVETSGGPRSPGTPPRS